MQNKQTKDGDTTRAFYTVGVGPLQHPPQEGYRRKPSTNRGYSARDFGVEARQNENG